MGLINKLKDIFKPRAKKPIVAVIGGGKAFHHPEEWKKVNEEIKGESVERMNIDEYHNDGLGSFSMFGFEMIFTFHSKLALLYGLTVKQAKTYGRLNRVALKHKKGRKHKKAINRMARILDNRIK